MIRLVVEKCQSTVSYYGAMLKLLLVCSPLFFVIHDSESHQLGFGKFTIGNLFRQLDSSVCTFLKIEDKRDPRMMLLEMEALNNVIIDLIKLVKKPLIQFKKRPTSLAQALISRNRPEYLNMKIDENELQRKYKFTSAQIAHFWELFGKTKKLRAELAELVKEKLMVPD